MHTPLNNRWSARTLPMASAANRFLDELSMDVLVLSFNRPYCLDRCLCSLSHHAHKIRALRILDDGTPSRYLDEIQRRHPQIEIVRSEHHAVKSTAIEESTGSQLLTERPWRFWQSGVQAASPRFLLLTDGQWCVRGLDLGRFGQIMKSRGCDAVRLVRNSELDRGPTTPFSPELCQIRPWYLRSRLRTWFCRWLLSRHWLDIENRPSLPLFSALSGIFGRDFWLAITRDQPDDRLLQTVRTLEWSLRHRGSVFARTTSDFIATTRVSLAWSEKPGHSPDSPGFDMTVLNRLLNEYWFAGRFDPCAGLPGDFPREAVLAVLSEAGDARCTPEKWSLWYDQFSENPGVPFAP